MDYQSIFVDYSQFLRTLEPELIHRLMDMLHSPVADRLFNIQMFPNFSYEVIYTDTITHLEDNMNVFFEEYSTSDIPTDEVFVPDENDLFLMTNILQLYVNSLMGFYTSIDKSVIITLQDIQYTGLTNLFMVYHVEYQPLPLR